MTSPTPEAWSKLQRLFREALSCAPADRESFIDSACGDDTLRDELRRLLAGHEQGRPEEPPRDDDERSTVASLVGRRVASYRVLDILGEGGMGIVYRAEQDQPRRAVALKVIHVGMTGPQRLRRFEHEAEILARLQHPGIAQVFDAGTFDAGFGAQPYFALELVEGEPLNAYLARREAGVAERLELLARIADAVHHAHQRGVIHRDLKPANILVNASGQPKVLDFGVARVTDAEFLTRSMRTGVGQLIGTIPYMSPEQASGDPEDLDTRSDVYALGVIAYEMLAGRLPYDVEGRTLTDAVRAIREDDPVPLSTIDRGFRGDVETIVATALEKDARRRYDSAAALAEDIRRFLRDEPIHARRPSGAEQVRRFTRRHKAMAGGIAFAGSVLVLASVLSTAAMLRALAAEGRASRLAESEQALRVRAQSEAETAEAVADFLNDTLAGADPARDPGHELTVREILDDAAARIDEGFAHRPLVAARVRGTIGASYYALGRYEESVTQLARALAACEAELGIEDERTIETACQLAVALDGADRNAEAQAILDPLVERAGRVLGSEHETTLLVLNRAAVNRYYRDPPAAAAVWREVLETQRRVLGPAHEETIATAQNLAVALTELRQLEEAEEMIRAALDGSRAGSGPRHPSTITVQGNLAWILNVAGKLEEAEPVAREAVELAGDVLGPEHPDTLFYQLHHARALGGLDRVDEAEAVYVRAAEGLEASLGPDHRQTVAAIQQRARLLDDAGRRAEAEPIFREVLLRQRRSIGPGHLNSLATINAFARSMLAQDRLDEAEALSAELITRVEDQSMRSRFAGVFHQTRGLCLLALERYEDAEHHLLAAHELHVEHHGEDSHRTRRISANLVELYTAWSKPEEAERWKPRSGADGS